MDWPAFIAVIVVIFIYSILVAGAVILLEKLGVINDE